MKLTLEVWRQESRSAAGRFETYEITDATPEMTLVELLDRLNDQISDAGGEPIWDLVARHLKAKKTVASPKLAMPALKNIDGNPGIAS